MPIDKKELSNLSPQERIKKLRLMGEERKTEVNDIERLIKESMQEIKTDKLAEEVAPVQRAVDISSLFESSNGQRLERTARDEAPPTALMRGARGYITVEQINYDYSKLKGFNRIVSMGGSLSEEQITIVDEIGARMNIGDRERYGPVGERIASLLDASRAVLRKYRKETGLG